MKFSEYVEAFIIERSIDLSPVTIVNYRRELVKAASVLGEKDMNEIGFLDMKEYFINLQSKASNSFTNNLLKHGTLVQHYIILHAFFENACENEIITANPMNKIKRPKQRKDEIIQDPVYYNEAEVKYILKCVSKEPAMWKALLFFVLDSGCRCGEAVALKWEEIDFSTGKVKICRNIQYTPQKGVYICSPKNGRNRDIYINKRALDILLKWKNVQEADSNTRGINCHGFCFTKRDGSLMMPGCFNAYLGRFGNKYGIKGIHPHALRHTMASLSITNGADIVSISKKLGHSKVATTLNVYSHTTRDAQKHANEVLAKAIYD